MDATGVSFAEQQMRRGKYYDQPPFPFVPGYDVVGRATATATGTGVDTGLPGHRFAAVTKTGSWASHLLIHADDLLPVPDGVDATATAQSSSSWAPTAASVPPSSDSSGTPGSQ